MLQSGLRRRRIDEPMYLSPWRENPNWEPRLERWPRWFYQRKKWMRPKFVGGYDYATDEELALIVLEEKFNDPTT